MKILLTGSTGFLGSALALMLESLGQHTVSYALRRVDFANHSRRFIVGDINAETNYSKALNGIDVVIHAAAITRVIKGNHLSLYRTVNVDGTLNLARQASKAGIKRFIFISSIKTLGESTTNSPSFTEDTLPNPLDFYGSSKYEAEVALKKVAAETGMELVIIRPPLVYGPGVRANFNSLLKLCAKPIPLPFGSVNNKRSMIYIGNLVDFIIKCIDHPAAAGQTLLVSDGKDVSLRYLITVIRSELGRSPSVFPIPIAFFKLVGIYTCRRQVVDRLIGDLQVDSSKACSLLGWAPPYTVEQGIAATVADFMSKEQ